VMSLRPPGLEPADLRIEDGLVTARARRLAARSNETVEDVSGRVVLPGLVCAHTHMYSALARGMPRPARQPRSFPEILSRVWWKLDQALDEESIYYSALVGAIDAIRHGTTTIIDHHASPNAIPGSLDVIRAAFAEAGIRGVLCYEVTDRGGIRRRDAGLAENDRFLSASSTDSQFRGLVGAHASFTLGDAALEACAEVVHLHRSGIHIHVAEAIDDVRIARARYGRGVVDRLARTGLLTRRSVLAHGVHLTDAELAKVRRSGAWLVHNPRSNMNNGVGHAPAHLFGRRAALGTDGFPADMLAEASFAQFRMRERLGARGRFDVTALLDGGARLASALFGMPFGSLVPGAAADLLVVDYSAPTPTSGANASAHLLGGVSPRMIESVMVGGRWAMRAGRLPGVDVDAVFRRSSRVAASLWTRMQR
jgi:putative selenium metabolism protein SsnA